MVSMCGRLTRFEWAVFGLSLLCYGTLLAAPEVMGPVYAEHSLPPSEAHILTPNHPRYFFIQFQTQAMLPMSPTGSNALGRTLSS